MEQETEASSPEFLLSTRCFSSNQTTDFMSISEAIQAWTETLAVLQTVLDCAGNGQEDFLFQYFALLQELAAASAHVGVGTAYVWRCVFTGEWRNIYQRYSTSLVVSHWFLATYNPSRLITPNHG